MNDDVVERVRRAIYDTFADQGRAPTRRRIQDMAAVDEAQVTEAIAELAAQRQLVLDQSGNVVMAHPFTTLNLGFSVMGEKTLWWGGCAWDSFAIPNLVKDEPSVLVATTCPACRRPQAWTVTRSGPPEGPEVAHFLVPMNKAWNDVVYTCSNQRLFCSEHCVQAWLASTGQAQGYLMDLPTLWRLASDWYSGRLDSPYQRKDPQSAADYFRSVGLHGPFWGLTTDVWALSPSARPSATRASADHPRRTRTLSATELQ
ncbi:MAG TPA: organomercurial lyase [Streptosporangiaceae bacterium]|nr:organomercurial lyase [Streptosporangiaceae bacterium]